MRKCSNCGEAGHYKKTCKKDQSQEEKSERKTLKEIGREILKTNQVKVARQPDDTGTIPVRGLWLVHPIKKRVLGKIAKVKKNGNVVWVGIYGAHVETNQGAIIDEGYQFIELEPFHLGWKHE